MLYHRGFSHDAEALHFKIVTLCVLFALSTFGPCTITGTHNPTSYDLNSGENRNQISPQTSLPKLNLENICKQSDLFCFPSTLSSFFTSQEANLSNLSQVKDDTSLKKSTPPTSNLTWSTNHGNFKLPNGNIVSCSLEYQENTQFNEDKEESFRIKSNHVNDFSSPNIQISHHVLDWGQKYLHFPSLAFLTIENKQNHTFLNVFEPYSTNLQFYPCNYSEIKINPGENASLCFIFLPKSLGVSSGHLILQTSFGGFLIRARGFAIESPYKIHQSINGKWDNFVVSNPSEKNLHLKEVNFWVSFSSRNVSFSIKGICNVIDQNDSALFSNEEWLDVKIGQLGQDGQMGQRVMAIRPQKWTIGSNHNEPILEFEFPFNSREKVYGSFCVKFKDSDTMILESKFGGKSSLSVSLDVLMPCDGNGTISVPLLIENGGPDVVKVVKIRAIGENLEDLKTKFVNGLILFPNSVTQVGIVSYVVNGDGNLHCKLLVETNKSDGHEVEISCGDIASLCLQKDGVLDYDDLGRVLPPLDIKATGMTKSDESILENWKSQATNTKTSILNNNNKTLTFPIVHINTHHSQHIKLTNPSNQPIIIQLLLNSPQIISNCQTSHQTLHPSSFLNSQFTPSKYGFSIPKHAITEAYIHPHKKAILGPIFFHPSNRCTWTTSALIKNNLTGVEWVHLQGSGGLPGLILLNGSDPVNTIKLEHGGFGQRSVKVLFVKNTGDLPVKVEKISISGTKCKLDGFLVSNCNGFNLLPGEIKNVMVTFRADFCAGIVKRELEFVMSGGILVVPVEVAISLPILTTCKRSFFWTRFKKLSLAVFVSIFLIFMACSCTVSFVIRDGNLPKMSTGQVESSSNACPKVEPVKIQPSSLLEIEVEKPENLTVKTGKDKVRRRKKKRASGSVSGLMGQYEVSSSHSSNSTPSSPLSPPSSLTPKKSTQGQHVQARSPVKCTVPSVKKEPSAPAKSLGLKARAPGAERKVVKIEGFVSDPKYKYNIWDDHLRVLPAIPEDKNFGSLFAMSPQELFTSVSYKHHN